MVGKDRQFFNPLVFTDIKNYQLHVNSPINSADLLQLNYKNSEIYFEIDSCLKLRMERVSVAKKKFQNMKTKYFIPEKYLI